MTIRYIDLECGHEAMIAGDAEGVERALADEERTHPCPLGCAPSRRVLNPKVRPWRGVGKSERSHSQ